jgi:HK97 family phage major capsid protein
VSVHPFLSIAQLDATTFPDVPATELAAFSLTRALRIAAGSESGRGTRENAIADALEGSMSRVVGARRPPAAVAIPLNLGDFRSALDSGTSGAGQELVFVRPGSFIDGVRARSVTGSLGATYQEGPLPMSEPRLDTDAAVAWVGEDPGSDEDAVEPEFVTVAYTPHTLMVTVPYSRQLVAQSFGLRGVDQVVARVAQGALGAEIDRVAVQGGAANEPTGLLGTAGIGSVVGGTNGLAPTYAHMVDLETEVATDDADAGRLGFATTPGMRQLLRQTEEITGGGRPLWFGRSVLGYPAAVSTNVPSNLTKGTASAICHAIIFGNWADLVVSLIPAMDVVVDPFARKNQGVVEVSFVLYLDVKARRPQSFAAMKDALTS